MATKRIRLGLLGCGVVGSGLAELLAENRGRLAARSGVELEIQRVLVRDLRKSRPVERSRITDRVEQVVEADDVDVVVELIGGVEPARDYVTRALRAGKPVVTANKALLAQSGPDLFRLAAARGVRLGFEASVCGGLPILRALGQGLVGDTIRGLSGIVNGTCNFILTRMAEDALSFEEALRRAQERGFAEADPSLDVDGVDAAQKLVVLSELAFGARVLPEQVPVEGIRSLGLEDVRAARDLGYVIKHLARARDFGGELELRVEPVLLPETHPLATVRDENNAVLVEGEAIGAMMFEGKGAGARPTATAVLADVIDAALDRSGGLPPPAAEPRPLRFESACEAYLRFPIRDLPGVIGLITTILGNHGISIRHASAALVKVPAVRRVQIRASVGELVGCAAPGSGERIGSAVGGWGECDPGAGGRYGGGTGTADPYPAAPTGDPEAASPKTGNVTILAHHCSERVLRRAVDQIARLPVLVGRPVVLRVFDPEGES